MTEQPRLYTIAELEARPVDPEMRRELIEGKLVESRYYFPIKLIGHRIRHYLGLVQSEIGGLSYVNRKIQLHSDPDTLLIADAAFIRFNGKGEIDNWLPTAISSYMPDLVVLIRMPFVDDAAERHWNRKHDTLQWHDSTSTIWVVDALEHTIEVFTRMGIRHGRTRVFHSGETLDATDMFPGLTFDLDELFGDIGKQNVPTLSTLPTAVRERIRKMRFDRILEKHEGPWEWNLYLDTAEIMLIEGYQVLLPIAWKDHVHIEILRTIVSKDEQTITVFLKDRTYSDPGDEYFTAGRIAVCDRIPETEVYIAVVYHEWYAVKNEGMP